MHRFATYKPGRCVCGGCKCRAVCIVCAQLNDSRRARGALLSSCACCQVFVDSTGGVKVPMFIVAPKDIKLDSSSPCLLYGYGGMEICTCPNEFAGCVLKVR